MENRKQQSGGSSSSSFTENLFKPKDASTGTSATSIFGSVFGPSSTMIEVPVVILIYSFFRKDRNQSSHHFRMEDGVVHVYASESDSVELFPVASATTFFTDMHHILKIISVGNVRSACYHRLRFLEEKFRLHLLANADSEFLAQKSAPHRDFYNIRKVDTHVHHSACMNQKHLLCFIKSKLRKEPNEVVIFRDGQYLTLKEV